MTELHAFEQPIISKAAMEHILKLCSPRAMNNTHTVFDIGYEQCKKDVLLVIARDMGLATQVHEAVMAKVRSRSE